MTERYEDYCLSDMPPFEDMVAEYDLEMTLEMEKAIEISIETNKNNTKFFDAWYVVQMRLIELGQER